jgi:hypothetical protein
MQHHRSEVSMAPMQGWRWVASVAGAFSYGACATAVDLDSSLFDRPEMGTPASAGQGGSGGSAVGGPADVRAPPSNEGRAGSTTDASVSDRVDERPAVDERPNVADTHLQDIVSCPDCVLRVQYRAGDTNETDNQIKPQFNVINTGSGAVPLVELTLRYWFTEGSTPQMFFCDYAMIGSASVVGRFGALPVPRPGANGYLEVGFAEAAGSLAPASGTGEIQGRCQKADFSPYQEADDYSFDPLATAYTDAPRVTLYRQGVLAWGVEP